MIFFFLAVFPFIYVLFNAFIWAIVVKHKLNILSNNVFIFLGIPTGVLKSNSEMIHSMTTLKQHVSLEEQPPHKSVHALSISQPQTFNCGHQGNS